MNTKKLWKFLIALIFVFGLFVQPAEAAGAEASGCGEYHIVQRGETLAKIGRMYGVSWRWLAEANNLRNPNRIYAGQRLCVPGQVDPDPDPTPACAQYHTVRRGETLAEIGWIYGVSWRWLWDVNNLSNPNRIYPGQRLCVEID